MECAYYFDILVDGTWNVPTTLTLSAETLAVVSLALLW